jgi:hypothetical protein
MKLMDRVKFQRPETGEICEALLAWDTGEAQFLHTWSEVGGKHVGPMVVEVARQNADGLFRRVTDYNLDQEAKDVLRTLQEMAANVNELDDNEENTQKI